MNKKELRSQMIKLREAITKEEKSILDKKAFINVINSKEYNRAKNIFIYVSYKSELYTHEIIKYSLKNGKKIFVPKVISKSEGMKAVEIKDFSDLSKSSYGILEPITNKYAEPSIIELSLTPGLAFDKSGGRIGYGGGFYDRYMKNLKGSAVNIGLCYKLQIIERVPMDEFDVRVDGIITD